MSNISPTKNKLQKIYIISWFGTDKRDKRKKNHELQIDWCIKNKLQPYVLPQQYLMDDRLPTVNYLPEPNKLLLPSEARNLCLKEFYNSDDDFAIFADNDSVLHDGEKYCDSSDFVSKFNNIDMSELCGVDLFFPLNPGKTPFTKTYTELSDQLSKYFIFMRIYDSKGSMLILRNLKKFYNLEIYFDENNYKDENNKIITHEDVDFGVQISKHLLGCHMLLNVVLKEMGSSTWTNDRSDTHNLGKTILARKHNLPLKENKISYKPLHFGKSNKILADKQMINKHVLF